MVVETEGLEVDKNKEKAQEETLNQEDKTADADATGKRLFNVVKVIVTATSCEVWGQGSSSKLSSPPIPPPPLVIGRLSALCCGRPLSTEGVFCRIVAKVTFLLHHNLSVRLNFRIPGHFPQLS